MVIRLAALTSHPIQYQAPLFREMASRDKIELTVYFCSRRGFEEAHDPEFGQDVEWDVPLLDGYEHEFLNRIELPKTTNGLSGFNPEIIKILKSRNHDAVWVHGYGGLTNWLAFAISRIQKIPIVLRGEGTRSENQTAIEQTKQILLSQLFDQIAAFASIGTRNRQFYKWHDIPEEKLFHAPYSVDNEFFQRRAGEVPQKQELRDDLGLPRETPVVLFVGKLIERKRPSLLLEVFARKTDVGEADLIFVGNGELRTELEQRTGRLRRQSDVHFAGFVNQNELPQYYAASDIFVLPSTFENWGLVVNEAMNFALPIITTEAVGCSDDLVNENGLVVPKNDAESLADGLEYMIANKKEREMMGAKSLEKINAWGIPETTEGIINAVQYTVGD